MPTIRSVIGALAVCSAWTTAVSVPSPPALAEEGGAPNIVFILADDLGWSDLGCYGNPVHDTPHLDQLAAEGMRFTDAYAPAPICSASRAAFLTGRSPARLHFEFVTKPRNVQPPVHQLSPPPYTQDLPLPAVTLAEALKPAGYVCGFSGKWHVNEHYRRYLGWSPTHGPKQQGFDVAIESFGSHPYAGAESSSTAASSYAAGEYPHDPVTENAIRFLEEHRDQRLFLCLWHYYVHTPVRAPTRWLLDKYQVRTVGGAGDPEKRAHYAAFVQSLDHYVGQILGALDRLKLTNNTLVVFTSDNGGHPEYSSNAPLRGSKWNLYEGGIRVPFIVRWPGQVSAGGTSDQPVVGMDLMPTFCQVARAPLPEGPLDGRGLVQLLKNGAADWSDRRLFWHFPYYHPETGYQDALEEIGVNDFAVSKTKPQSALRAGRFKLVRFYEDDRHELYDLTADPGERADLSAAQPQATQQLAHALETQLEAVNARFPTRVTPGFRPLFNAQDLTGWKVPAGNAGQWSVTDGLLDCEVTLDRPSKSKLDLWTEESFADFRLRFDWRFKRASGTFPMPVVLPDNSYQLDDNGDVLRVRRPNADSGILLRGSKAQVNLWCWPVGSGYIEGYRKPTHPPAVRAGVVPTTRADRPIGQWNSMEITARGQLVSVILNGMQVISEAYLPDLPARGPLGLQYHIGRNDDYGASSLVQFRNIELQELE